MTIRNSTIVRGTAAALIVVGAAMAGCSGSEDDVVHVKSAVTASPGGLVDAFANRPTSEGRHRADLPKAPAPPLPEVLVGARDPRHRTKEVNAKPQATQLALTEARRPSAVYTAKQSDYLKRWRDLAAAQPSMAPEAIEAQRAALKHSVLGE